MLPADLDTIGLPALSRPMPGRGRRLAWCWGSFAVSVAVTAVVVAAGFSTGALFVEPLAQLVVFAVLPAVHRLRLAGLLADGRYRTVPAPALAAAVLAVTAPSGVREVTVRVGQVGGFTRCFRAGGRTVVLVHERLPVVPEATRFFLAHEAAHLARYDTFRRPAALMTALVCLYAVGTAWPLALIPGVVAVVAVVAAVNRSGERDCDRLALRWVGLASAEQAFSVAQRAYRRSVRSLLTHPAPARRLAACRLSAEE
ncbi:M48 family metalloprotease [Actinoallomurus sp. CA-142502]|uniref:M48 family metalloprotease n=1 Tax=Actinoallomurus sp. CA-142502 TaxID=3239885 RepID=UPI003D90C43A